MTQYDDKLGITSLNSGQDMKAKDDSRKSTIFMAVKT